MAKWFGKIGFEGQTVETAPSVFTEETVEREYYGDVLEWGRQLQASWQTLLPTRILAPCDTPNLAA